MGKKGNLGYNWPNKWVLPSEIQQLSRLYVCTNKRSLVDLWSLPHYLIMEGRIWLKEVRSKEIGNMGQTIRITYLVVW